MLMYYNIYPVIKTTSPWESGCLGTVAIDTDPTEISWGGKDWNIEAYPVLAKLLKEIKVMNGNSRQETEARVKDRLGLEADQISLTLSIQYCYDKNPI